MATIRGPGRGAVLQDRTWDRAVPLVTHTHPYPLPWDAKAIPHPVLHTKDEAGQRDGNEGPGNTG